MLQIHPNARTTPITRAEIRTGKLIVLWDGAPYHRAKTVWSAAGSLGIHLLPLPGYSPDLSPIEPGWAKVKSYLRRVAPRTVEALEQALGPALDSITAQDAAGFFRHCDYVCPN